MTTRSNINGTDVIYTVADPSRDEINAAYQPGDSVVEIARTEGADIASNFNFANNTIGAPIGRLIVDGQTVVQDIPVTAAREELYMLQGKLYIGKAPEGAAWAVQGSPPLLRDRQKVFEADIERDQLGSDIWTRAAIRTAVGIDQDGLLVLLRTIQAVTLDQLADIMLALGCVHALNGDGGGSAYLYPYQTGWGRKMGSAIIVKRGDDDMSKSLLIIDPGHGGNDPGGGSNSQWREKDFVLQISLYQYRRFQELGLPVAMTRTTDVTLSSAERTRRVRASGATHCISNHINAAVASARGAETIRSLFDNSTLAQNLYNAIVAEGMPGRRVFTRMGSNNLDYYFMHRETGRVATVIVEYGFATNPQDTALLSSHWERYSEAVVRAYCQHVGHRYTPPKKEEEKTVEMNERFKDVPKGHWAESSIIRAANAGVIAGVTSDRFGLGQPVTREQLAVMFDRAGVLTLKRDNEERV